MSSVRDRLGLGMLLVMLTAGFVSAGEPLTERTAVKKGDKLLAEWAGKWEEVQVLDVLPGGKLQIRWTKWGPTWDGAMERTKLRLPDGVGPARAADGSLKTFGGKRDWTDATGKYKTEAEFVALTDGKVQLKRPDGKLVTLPLEKLAAADQELARTLAKEAGMSPGSDNPFEADIAEPAAPATAAKAPEEFKTAEGDWSSVLELQANLAGPLTLPPSAALEAKPKYAARSISLTGDKQDQRFAFFEKAENIGYVPSQDQAWIFHVNGHGQAETQSRVERIDLVQGKSLGSSHFRNKCRPLAGDPAGRRVLTAPNDFATHNTVDLWEFDEKTGEPKHVVRWRPFQPEGIIHRAATFAEFVDEGHVLVGNDFGIAVLWQISATKAVYAAKLSSSGARPAFSRNHNYLAAPVAGGIGVFEATSGKTLGKLEGRDWQRVAFRADGKQLAAADSLGVAVYDCQTGKLLYESAYLTQITPQTLDWAGVEHLLVNGMWLIDPLRRVTIWKYEIPALQSTVRAIGDGFWYVSGGGAGGSKTLHNAAIPHPAVQAATATLDPQKLVAFQSGAKVRLEMLTPLPADEQQKVIESLTSQLKLAGATVAADGPFVLSASIEAGVPKAINYSRFGFGHGGDAGVFTEQKYKLELRDGETVLWHIRYTQGAPGSLQLKRDQTVEAALQEASLPRPKFFLDARIPHVLTRPGPFAGAYGSTNLP